MFNGRYPFLTNPLWEQIRDRAEGFSSLAAWGPARFDLAQGGEARYADAIWVSGGFFHTLGVRPAAGRLLAEEDDRRGCASPAVVISHAFWQRELGGAAEAVGGTIHLDGHPFPVLGVTEPGFFGVEPGRRFDVAVPLCAEPILLGTHASICVTHGSCRARALRPGWTVDARRAARRSRPGSSGHRCRDTAPRTPRPIAASA